MGHFPWLRDKLPGRLWSLKVFPALRHSHTLLIAAQFPGGLLPAIRDAPKLSEPFSVVRLPNFFGFLRWNWWDFTDLWRLKSMKSIWNPSSFYGFLWAIPSRTVLENQLFTIEMSDLLQKKNIVGWPRYPMIFFFAGDINHIPWRTRSCTTPEYFTSCWDLAGFLLRGSFHLILVSLRAHQISPWVFLLTSHPLVGSYPSSCGVNPIQQITPPVAQFPAIWGINTISCLFVFSPHFF